MKFVKLEIIYEEVKREFSFSESVNLILSKENSVGKSTLLRLLFYAMGYSIPSTKGIDFTKVSCKLWIETVHGEIVLKRLKNQIELEMNKNKHLFTLPNESEELHALIFDSSNTNVVTNIIGSIYLDQEKGWTLLNKGFVIGRIYFDLNQLVAGLAERNIEELETELFSVSTELKKYKTMKSLYDYKTTLIDFDNNNTSDDYIDELERDLNILLIEKNSFDEQIKEMELSVKDNRAFVRYIENMKLFVIDGEKEIQVTKDNLANFEDNQNLINTRKKILEIRASKIETKINKLKKRIEKESQLLSLQSEIEKFDNQVSELIINPLSVDKIIKRLKKRENELKEKIKAVITNNNDVINNLYFTVKKYANELDVSQYMDDNKNYIFTNDLKVLSGAVYHKIVFIFKIAYITEIQKYLKIKLPIVLDSPSGREVDQKNIEDIMNILNRDFKENQIIIASIYEDYKFDNISKFEIRKGLFRDA